MSIYLSVCVYALYVCLCDTMLAAVKPSKTQHNATKKKPKGEKSSLSVNKPLSHRVCMCLRVHSAQSAQVIAIMAFLMFIYLYLSFFFKWMHHWKSTNKHTHKNIINDYTVLLPCKVIIVHFIIMCYTALKTHAFLLYSIIFRRVKPFKTKTREVCTFAAFISQHCRSWKSIHSIAYILLERIKKVCLDEVQHFSVIFQQLWNCVELIRKTDFVFFSSA